MDPISASKSATLPSPAVADTAARPIAPMAFPRWAVVLLAVLYVLPGLAGFGPWKPDEPYVFGMVHSLMQSGDWVVPTLAGEPFMEKPPLYMWVAALTAWLASPWMTPDHGARLAIGVFMLVTLVGVSQAARRWWGHGHGRHAALALLGSLGLAQHGHMMIPDLPLLAGFAIGLWGFSWMQDRPLRGGALLGTGMGMAFLAKGMLGPGALGLAALALPVLFRDWRRPAYARALLAAALAALPWFTVWPTALYLRSPSLFIEWFWVNNIGRFLGFSVPLLGATHEPGHLRTTLPWFTFPALPLAVWALWRAPRATLANGGWQASVTVFGVTLAALAVSASGRVVYLLPLLAPLAVMAAPGIALLPRRVDALADWSARLLFGVATLTLWGVALWFSVHGAPPAWPLLARHLPMDFVFHLAPASLLAAALAFAAWFVLLPRLPAFRGRALASWTAGIALVWATLFTLLLPWIDAAKSYQPMFRAMSYALPADLDCLASRGLGESERGMLHYVTGIRPYRVEVWGEGSCSVLLQQGLAERPPHLAAEGWHLLWEGSRPGEKREHFWLFYRADDVADSEPIAAHDRPGA